MKPRSIVFTLYGDYLRYCGDGEAGLTALTELLGLFGVEPSTTRVVMSRLRADGWFVTRKNGRSTSYLLSDEGWRLLNEGRERIFRREHGSWDGQWTMVLFRVPDGDRALRERLKSSLSWFGFGPLQPSVWLSPHERTAAASRLLLAEPGVEGEVFHSSTGSLERDIALASRCWDLRDLDQDYARFTDKHAGSATLVSSDEEALRRRVELTDDYRVFPFRDPDLPIELLPDGWRGWRAHDIFARAHATLRERAESLVGEIVGLPVMNSPLWKSDVTSA